MCTNEPEICNFISNDLTGGDMSIQKCDWCKDGYLVVKKTANGAILGCTNYKPDNTGCGRRMSPDYYHRWITSGFEDDVSVDKPSYQKQPIVEMPKIKASQNIPSPKNKEPVKVHTITHSERFIEHEGFQVIADDDGQILTDMELLAYLRNVRSKIMKTENKPAYTIIGNKGLVSLATYRPENREEFIALYGLGETTYNSHGLQFIQAIKDFEKNS